MRDETLTNGATSDEIDSKSSGLKNGVGPKSNGLVKDSNGVSKESNRLTKRIKNGDISPAKEDAAASADATGNVEQPLIWLNIIAISLFHLIALYATLTFPYFQRPLTWLWSVAYGIFCSFGVGAGVHRLWTHRSYKAKTPLRILLLVCFSAAGMNSIFDWVRDHRVHHKFSETDADPHNSNRGFFFSHVGWLMMRKHPEVYKKGRQIDMSDISADPVVAFGEKHFILLKVLFCFILPTLVPVYFWDESWYWAIMSQVFMRYAYVLNATWSVNSVAHMFGYKPYDKMIAPVENKLISHVTGGEGWHNYHHVFPWDYKASEIGHYESDFSTIFIDTFAKIGWAYDLKEPTPDLVKAVIANKGDGTHTEVPAPSDETKFNQ